MTQDDWLQLGIHAGFCDPPVCNTHEGVDLTDEENDAFEDGDDPCIHVVRLRELDDATS